jgi:hypothetical protein
MTQPSQSRQPRKKKPTYELVGLTLSDYMPIQFRGRTFDLANLSAKDLAFLLKYPKSVPYVKPI